MPARLNLVFRQQQCRLLPDLGSKFIDQSVLLSHPGLSLLYFLIFLLQPFFSSQQLNIALAFLLF